MYDEAKMSLILLLSLAVNYPVLKSWGVEVSKLLILAVDSGEGIKAMNLLGKSSTPRLDVLMSNKSLADMLLKTNSDFVFCPYSRSRRGRDLVERLCSVAKTGTVEGIRVTALPLVIVEGFPVELMEQDAYKIFLDGSLEGISIERSMVIPPDYRLEVVEDKIRLVSKEACSRDEMIFLSAACFLYPNLVYAGQEEEFNAFVACAKRLVERTVSASNMPDLSEAFIRELYQWQERTEFCKIYELPNVDMRTASELESCIFYDDEYLFMKEQIFKSVVASLLQFFPLNSLKASLVSRGVLCPENVFTYTSKMAFYNVAGQYQRERMLRFRRNKISILGEMDFIELCLWSKEDRENDRYRKIQREISEY